MSVDQAKFFDTMYGALNALYAVPPVTLNHGQVEATVEDCYVVPGAIEAFVRVSLNVPPLQTMVARFMTVNDTATEGSYYTRVDSWLTFQPGEQCKIVRVPLKGNLADRQLKVTLTAPQNTPGVAFKIVDGTGYIRTDAALRTPDVPIPSRLKLAFEDSLLFATPTDAGLTPEGGPTWRSRLQHGRTQPDNKELGYYADPVLNPGSTPWLVENGKFVLQAQYLPDGVKDAAGAVIPCAWDGGNPFVYSAAVITTEKLFANVRVGSYFEAKLTMPVTIKSWPAFWLLPLDGSWPSIELDMFEGFFSSAPGGLPRVGTTVHWKNSAGGHSMFSSFLPHLGIDLAGPHVWGCYWGEKQVEFYCDRVRYFSVPNVFPDKACYLLLDIAVSAKESIPTMFPAKMTIDFVRVWQPA